MQTKHYYLTPNKQFKNNIMLKRLFFFRYVLVLFTNELQLSDYY